jgi:DNA repair protein RadC
VRDRVCGSFAGVYPVEVLRVVHLDRHRRVLDVVEYVGEAMRVTMPLRTIIGDALRLGTSGLLLSHNHPSGDPTPSRADISATQRLMRAAHALDIRVHDHLIIGGQRRFSLRAAGLI